MKGKPRTIVVDHKKFWLLKTDAVFETPDREYVLFRKAQTRFGNTEAVETFLAQVEEDAIKTGYSLAIKHGLFP